MTVTDGVMEEARGKKHERWFSLHHISIMKLGGKRFAICPWFCAILIPRKLHISLLIPHGTDHQQKP